MEVFFNKKRVLWFDLNAFKKEHYVGISPNIGRRKEPDEVRIEFHNYAVQPTDRLSGNDRHVFNLRGRRYIVNAMCRMEL